MSDRRPKYLQDVDRSIRQSFAKKVYSLLSLQLLTTVLIATVIYRQDIQWVSNNMWLMVLSMIGSFGLIITLMFKPSLGRTVPGNYAFLATFTVFESVLVGFATSVYSVESVLWAVALTGGIFTVLTILALTVNIDLTGWLPYLTLFLFGLIFMGLVLMFFPSSTGRAAYSVMGALVMGCYILVDTQMIFRGSKDAKFSYTIDDYVYAAIAVYLDIINLFLQILSLLGERRQ